MNFKIFFNKKKQWVNVSLWDVHPSTFARWKAGRWAYFLATWENPKAGEFGELHFVVSGLRFDTLSHEIFHVLAEWMMANREPVSSKNEEKYAVMTDELSRKVVREIRKIYPKIRL